MARLPSARTVVNWLKQFTQATLAPLVQLNQELVLEAITRLKLPRLTIDIDSTVVQTGVTVASAFRGSIRIIERIPATTLRASGADGAHPAAEESPG